MELIISGFISKVVSDCVDIFKSKIRGADENRKGDKQSIETKIYQVTIDAIKKFKTDSIKSKDDLYNATESILKEFKSGKDKCEAVKIGLNMLESQITNDRCQEFLDNLCDEICKHHFTTF